MSGEEARELKTAIARVRKTATVIKIISISILGVFSFGWVFLTGLVLTSGQSGGFVEGEAIRTLVYVMAYGLVMLLLLLSSVRIFSNIASGESPFTESQVKLFRAVGFLFALLALVEAVLSYGFSYDASVFGTAIVVEGNDGMPQSHIRINAAMMFLAAMFFGLSIVFRYGALLQRLSDETE